MITRAVLYSEGIVSKIRVIIDLKLIHQQLKGLLFTVNEWIFLKHYDIIVPINRYFMKTNTINLIFNFQIQKRVNSVS
jgi:hypothetical protein